MSQSTDKNASDLTSENLMDTPSRTAYLPLVSPSIEEKPQQKNDDGDDHDQKVDKSSGVSPTKRRRESSEGNYDLGYFAIKKAEIIGDEGGQSASGSGSVEKPIETSLSDISESSKVSEGSGKETQPVKRARIPLVSLPDEIGDPLMRAIEQSMGSEVSNHRNTFHDDDDEVSSMSSFSTSSKVRTHRAMSVPRNLRSQVHPVTAFMIAHRRTSNAPSSSSPDQMTDRQRRNSIRAQQLSLLASQARLARTGTSNVNTALRTEMAVKGAVLKAVEDVQARKQRESNAGLISNGSGSSSVSSEEKGGEQVKSEREEIKSISDASETDEDSSHLRLRKIRNPIHAWSEALADADTATSFLDSAKEVANHWANGFYAYEKEWIGSALEREQKKLEAEGQALGSNADLDDEIEVRVNARRTSVSAPPAPMNEDDPGLLSEKDIVIAVQPPKSISVDVGTVKQKLMEAQRRMSKTIIPAATLAGRTSIHGAAMALGEGDMNDDSIQSERFEMNGGGSGKLVDVLSNFATLIDSHKEGCHSLEKLAQNARRLSAVQLPSVIRYDPPSIPPTSHPSANNQSAVAAAAARSTVSSEAGSPLSVMGSVG